MEKELYELIGYALNMETKNNYVLESNYMEIFLPNNNKINLIIKKCSDVLPTSNFTTNHISQKIGYGKNNPYYNKITLKNTAELQHYILDALNTILNLDIKLVFIETEPSKLVLFYSI